MKNIYRELFSVEGKTAVVTGGAKGIGAMISEALLVAGAKVIVVSRSASKEVRENFGALGEVTFLNHDLLSSEGVNLAAKEITSNSEDIHILVNNAGAFSASPISDTSEEDWDEVMALNLRTSFFLAKGLLEKMKSSASQDDPARIINIGSIGALWGQSSGGAYAYGSSKAAIQHLTRMLASDLTGQGVTVNAIAPGFFPSNMTDGFFEAVPGLKAQTIEAIPAGRLGTQQDIGGAVLFLSSRAGAYVSGTTLPLEGALWQK